MILKPLFLDLDLSNTNGIASIYDKRDTLNLIFETVNFPFLGGDFPPPPFLWCIHFATYSFCKSMFSC